MCILSLTLEKPSSLWIANLIGCSQLKAILSEIRARCWSAAVSAAVFEEFEGENLDLPGIGEIGWFD